MHVRRVTLAAAVFALTTACTGGRSSGSASPSFTVGECPEDVQIRLLVRHSCGYLTVPEDRNQAHGRTVSLFVVRIIPPPDQRPRSDPVLILGDEIGAVPNYGKIQGEAAHLHRVVYILDARGTGHSRPSLSCPEIDRVSTEELVARTGDPSLRQKLFVAVRECRSRLLASGIDPSDFDLTTMAADVEDLRRALGVASWNLATYGTWSRLALEVIREHPDHVRAAYLDSPQFPQLDEPTEGATGMRLVLVQLFAACAQASCRDAYPGLRRRWREAVTRLDAHPIEAHTQIGDVLVDGGAFVRGIEAVLEDDAELPRFPALISAARHGRIDIDITTALASRGSICAGYRFDCLPHFSAGVYLSVLCRDEAPFMDPSALHRATARIPGLDAALGANPYLAACSAWKVPPAAPTVHAPVHASVPVLMVSGQFDPFAPPSLTRRFGRSLVASFPIEVLGLTHNPLESSGCQVRIRDAWLERPQSLPDSASCLRRMSVEFATR